MSEYALVNSGIVKAVIVADAAFISEHGAAAKTTYGFPTGSWFSCSGVGRGWTHDGTNFAAPTFGKSVSGATPATSATSGDTLTINLNGDGAQTITLATSATAALVAADIQAKVRALTAADSAKQPAYNQFVAEYASSLYTLTTGTRGAGGSVVVSGGTASVALKLGTANGGTETSGTGE